MDCLYCSGKTVVVNSRPQKRLMQVWRRRKCTKCGAIFTTNELVELGSSFVVIYEKGEKHPFNRDSLFLSIMQACGHRKDAINDAGALTATIIAQVRKGSQGASISRKELIASAIKTLRQFDTVAAVQYGAYHAL